MSTHEASIGVVLPTLNCVSLLPEHLASMQPWLDLVSQVIVVDSHSDDGTVEMIRERLSHPGLRILSHPRGLYQSWNFGLRQLHTKYVYISTVGDSITRFGLEHLREVAEQFQCDVVASEPRFLTGDGKPLPHARWPIADVCSKLQLSEPTHIQGMKLFLLVLFYAKGGAAILGSSASNLYRTQLLQERPFPLDFGLAGDVAWAITHVFDYRLGVTPERFSTFRRHTKAYSIKEYAVDDIYLKSFMLARDTFRQRLVVDHALQRESDRLGCSDFLDLVSEFQEWSRRLRKLRKGNKLWVFSLATWHARTMRNRVRRQVNKRENVMRKNFGIRCGFALPPSAEII